MKILLQEESRDLFVGLEQRRAEIGNAILARVKTIETPDQISDPEYAEGLRAAVEAAIDHTIEASRARWDRQLTVPATILGQARLAARRRVPLDTMLRRYLAGHAVLGDFMVEEGERSHASPSLLRKILRSQAAATDHVLSVIAETYLLEADAARSLPADERLADQVRRLIDGELLDPERLNYQLDRWHIGLIAAGPDADQLIAAAAREFDAAKLVVKHDDEATWAWLGSRRPLDCAQVSERLAEADHGDAWISVGEPGRGIDGWRLTHRQARAALPVARRQRGTVRYGDVLVVASVLQDELLVSALEQLYLEPLRSARNDEEVLLQTLREYLASGFNSSSTAAALCVSRQTVRNRLQMVERILGRSLPSCALELQLAMRLPTAGPG